MNRPEQFPIQAEGATLADRIASWQAVFDVVPTDVAAVELRVEAQEDLDTFWEFIKEPCEIRGMAKVETWRNGICSSRLEFIDCDTAKSFGLIVAKIGATAAEKWQVCYGFEKLLASDQAPLDSETIYLLPKNASIVSHNTVDTAFEAIFQPHAVLIQHSEALARNLADPAFFYLTRDEQLEYIESQLDVTTEQVRQWGGVVKPVLIEEAARAYARVSDGAQDEYEAIDITNVVIGGECLGLEVLARSRLLTGRSITDLNQLVDVDAGLFLRVAIDADTAISCNLLPQQAVYLPISSQDMGICFLENVVVDS